MKTITHIFLNLINEAHHPNILSEQHLTAGHDDVSGIHNIDSDLPTVHSSQKLGVEVIVELFGPFLPKLSPYCMTGNKGRLLHGASVCRPIV